MTMNEQLSELGSLLTSVQSHAQNTHLAVTALVGIDTVSTCVALCLVSLASPSEETRAVLLAQAKNLCKSSYTIETLARVSGRSIEDVTENMRKSPEAAPMLDWINSARAAVLEAVAVIAAESKGSEASTEPEAT